MALTSKCKIKESDRFPCPINISLTPLLTVLLIFGVTFSSMDAQVRLQDPSEKETPFTDQLWYGGNVNLGFQGSNLYNVFFFGLSPMVGYKVNEDFSVGPRVEIFYTYYKAYVWSENRNLSAHPISFSYGVFARHKLFRQVFAHAEFHRERATFPLRNQFGDFFSDNGKLATGTLNFDNLLIGLGYFSRWSKWGSEISLLYNLLDDDQTLALPITIRVGINYNF